MKRLALFVLLAGLGVRSASAQLAFYVDESGRRVYINPEPKQEISVPKKIASKPPARVAKAKLPPTTPAPAAVAAPFGFSNLDTVVQETARRHDVDVSLVKAIIKTESNNNPRAISPKGAQGLMQLMPPTARQMGVSNSFDPVQNVDGGVRYLKTLLTMYSGDVPLSLAAYNAGPGAVERHGGVPPYRETREYVRKVGDLYGTLRMQAPPDNHAGKIVKYVDEDGKVLFTNLR